MKMIFDNTYDGESIVDLSRDIHEAFDSDFNMLVAEVPVDEYGFMKGEFKVTVTWIPPKSGT